MNVNCCWQYKSYREQKSFSEAQLKCFLKGSHWLTHLGSWQYAELMMLYISVLQSCQMSNAAPDLLDQLTDRPQLEAVTCWSLLLYMSAASWRPYEVQQHLTENQPEG